LGKRRRGKQLRQGAVLGSEGGQGKGLIKQGEQAKLVARPCSCTRAIHRPSLLSQPGSYTGRTSQHQHRSYRVKFVQVVQAIQAGSYRARRSWAIQLVIGLNFAKRKRNLDEEISVRNF
jgi:hypothetical protein